MDTLNDLLLIILNLTFESKQTFKFSSIGGFFEEQYCFIKYCLILERNRDFIV